MKTSHLQLQYNLLNVFIIQRHTHKTIMGSEFYEAVPAGRFVCYLKNRYQIQQIRKSETYIASLVELYFSIYVKMFNIFKDSCINIISYSVCVAFGVPKAI